MSINRRQFIAGTGLTLTLTPLSQASSLVPAAAKKASSSTVANWARGTEGQRKADLGNGQFLNPVMAGDFPDPSVLKDGEDYYMTHSSFDGCPGLLIWHSKDLVNWTPVCSALDTPLGTVFAVDLVKHNGKYFIYIPFMKADWSTELKSFANIYVIQANNIAGPWSEPVDLGIYTLIDPGHMAGEDGRRYLFLSGVNRVPLSDDGLSVTGPVEKVYDGWRYPDEWVTEAYALEGPKLFKRGNWFYMVSAVGGTSGPATGHMVIVARSASIHGPWENCPHNPIVRTYDADDYWWSRGHATMVEGPNGQWYMVYHGYENGYRSLGRQTLVEPMRWSADGWPVAMGGDLSLALPKPKAPALPHGIAHSDDFSDNTMGIRWVFFGAPPREQQRLTFNNNALTLQGAGTSPANSAPLVQTVGDLAYEISVKVDIDASCEAGLLLFFNNRLFLGMGLSSQGMTTYRGGKASFWREPVPETRSLYMKIRNNHHIVTFYYSVDGKTWQRHGVRSEVSGYNANTIDDLQALRPALYCSKQGQAVFREFTYQAI